MPAPDPEPVGTAAPPAPAEAARADALVAARHPSTARVLAVLVTHDGEGWLPRVLDSLAAQTHEALDVVAVDNGSTDGSREVLLDHLADEQVLVADRDLGFGAAVSMALDARSADEVPYVLLLHDDLELAPDAIAELVRAMDEDPRLAIVGPKLLDWDDRRRLQSVGWTVDLTGRADSGVDEGELDQGQRDIDRRTLYVSSGGMLLRRDVFDELGRFDRRYHLFRDDLDLCWRAWLAGHDVEVVPEAVAGHAASATNYGRLGQTRFIGPRYFAERNTLATLLKNYGRLRLLTVVPLFFVVGVAKVLGFLLTRRFSDAWQTVRAWLWNGLHLRETWRLRRQVQRDRRRDDDELKQLFGRISPRVQAYVEAIGDWVAGGDIDTTPAVPRPEVVPEPETATRRLLGLVTRRPVLVTGTLLGILVLVAAAPLLAPGSLRGGEFAPWPASSTAFLADHASAWHTAAGLGTDQAPSPAQALLGLLQGLLLGSSYLAPRVLLVGTLLVAWLFTLRATQRYSPRKLPRVAAATVYVLSPPVLAAFRTGQLGALVVFAALPGLVAALGTLVRRETSPARAWRAAAGAALLGGVAGAFVPQLLPLLLVAGVVVLVAVLPTAPWGWRGPLTARVLLATSGPVVVLLPWSASLLAADGPLRDPELADPVVSELWRWVLLVPEASGFPTAVAGVGFLLAGILGMLFGWRRQHRLVLVLWALAFLGAVGGWALGRLASPVWPGLPLGLTAASFAGLLAVAFARGEASLGRHAFGWRQVAAATTVVAVVVSVGSVAVSLARGPGDSYVIDVPALPQFVTAAASPGDPFRVLVLAEVDDELRYEVVPDRGPSMAATGVPLDPAATDAVDEAVSDLASGRDVRAGTALGRLGIRYVVVPDGGIGDTLDEALRRQTGLDPRPVASGRVLAVTDALPRASIVPAAAAATFAETGALPEGTEVTPLPSAEDGRISTRVDEPGVLLLTEPADAGWVATADGSRLRSVDAPTVAFEVPEGDVRLEVVHDGQGARGLALAGQLLAVLLVFSLALRPPGFARRGDDPLPERPDEPEVRR